LKVKKMTLFVVQASKQASKQSIKEAITLEQADCWPLEMSILFGW